MSWIGSGFSSVTLTMLPFILTLRRKTVVFLTEKGYFLRVVMRGHPVVDTVRKLKKENAIRRKLLILLYATLEG